MSSVSAANWAALRCSVPRSSIAATNELMPCVVSFSASNPPKKDSRNDTSGTLSLGFTSTRSPLGSWY